MNVTFNMGEVVNGWRVKGTMGLSRFFIEKGDILVAFDTDAGSGVNCSNVLWYTNTKTNRRYKALKSTKKYMGVVKEFANVLYQRYTKENNERNATMAIMKKCGLVISEGTCKIDDLLISSLEFLLAHDLNLELRGKICNVFHGIPTRYDYFHGHCEVPEENQAEASELFYEDIYNYFNELAPWHYCFGTQEGDGSCFGWFQYLGEE